ncbi:MAG: dihydroneopterin aldolase [Nitrospira sp.]|nr:dihydroneopterin aldolase [Nitrospira sp.]
MSSHIIIERLEFRGRCGVTAEERAKPQPLAVDVEMDAPLDAAGRSDNLADTIDYANIARRLVEIGSTQEACLLETMAERFLAMLFADFPITRANLWLRKLHAPISQVTRSVGIRLDRTRLAQQLSGIEPKPATFLVEQLHRLPKGTALDVAAGGGRHSLLLAARGYHVDAIDRDAAALSQLSASAAKQERSSINTKVVDLEQPAPFDPGFGHDTYDVIVVFFYLHRPLFPFLVEALKPGGVLIYETFTIDNYTHHKHPRRWEFCLSHNELLRMTSALQVLHYDEGAHDGVEGPRATYTAQLVAQKPLRSAHAT